MLITRRYVRRDLQSLMSRYFDSAARHKKRQQPSSLLLLNPAKQDFIAERLHLRSRFLPSLTDFIAPMAPVCRSRENSRRAHRLRVHTSARTARFRIRGMRCRFAVVMYSDICKSVEPRNRLRYLAQKKTVALLRSATAFFGAGSRGRTDTVLLPSDFESDASANSTIPAFCDCCHGQYYSI